MMQTQLDRYLYPVDLARNPLDNKLYVCNALTKRSISEVSNRYCLVPNKDLVQPVVDYFGIDRLKSVKTYNGNRSFLFEFMTGREFDFGGGDIIKERILIRNSYDKTRSFSFMAGAFRMVCSNGLYVGVGSVVTYKKIHVGEIPVRSLVENAIANFPKNDFSFWNKLREIPLDVSREEEIINAWVPFKEVKEDDYSGNRVLNRTIKWRAASMVVRAENVDNQRNAWGLYNQLNQAIDRTVAQGQIDKKIAGNLRMENYLKKVLSLN